VVDVDVAVDVEEEVVLEEELFEAFTLGWFLGGLGADVDAAIYELKQGIRAITFS
jgi:hypothetical protein